MSDLDEILKEDMKWYKEFHSMRVTGTCDAFGCNKPATTWFGNSSAATCGDAKCIDRIRELWNTAYEECEE